MDKYENMKLDDLIKLYAEAAARDLTDTDGETFERRVDTHNALCKILGVKHDDFKPFEGMEGMSSVMNPAMAERLVRMEIRRIKPSAPTKSHVQARNAIDKIMPVLLDDLKGNEDVLAASLETIVEAAAERADEKKGEPS